MNTYKQSFYFKLNKDWTKSDLVKICLKLEEKFGEGYEFEPEAISEGGILWKNYPGKTRKMYKTLRFRSGGVRFPFVNSSVMEEWKGNSEIVFKSGSRIGTFLKSFHNSPEWTDKDINTFKHVFSQDSKSKTKLCPECKVTQNLTEFYFISRHKGNAYLSKRCKPCHNRVDAARRNRPKKVLGFAALPLSKQTEIKADLLTMAKKEVAAKHSIKYSTLTYWQRKFI